MGDELASRRGETVIRRRPQRRHAVLHGDRVAYRVAGDGPPIVLIHGITSDSSIWERVMPGLAREHTVIAPDLPGHGSSDKPKGDYSLGAHACCVRDLLLALGHERVTLVGHSLGGGIAMQFSYQFPEMCDRLVLVDSGGLGRDVSVLLRAASLPGSELVLPLLASSRLLGVGARLGGALGRVGLRLGTDLEQMARGHNTLSDGASRAAFLHTLRAVVDPAGQRIDATNRLYLAERMPLLLIWGERDSIIPVAHGRAAHARMSRSRLEVLERSGHFPMLDEPECFLEVLLDFVAETEPVLEEALGA
jgi:pimeloyl-ACP methyl ester carboxylesterase